MNNLERENLIRDGLKKATEFEWEIIQNSMIDIVAKKCCALGSLLISNKYGYNSSITEVGKILSVDDGWLHSFQNGFDNIIANDTINKEAFDLGEKFRKELIK